MSLPLPWVERIFDKLTLVYGQAFLRRWQDVDMERVKADWAHELNGLDKNPKAIAYALQNLPAEKPPTVLEFRNAANRMPAEAVPALPLERLEADIVAGFIQKARAVPMHGRPDGKDWARNIISRYDAGDKIRPYCIKLARSAIAPRLDMSEAV